MEFLDLTVQGNPAAFYTLTAGLFGGLLFIVVTCVRLLAFELSDHDE